MSQGTSKRGYREGQTPLISLRRKGKGTEILFFEKRGKDAYMQETKAHHLGN